MKKVAVIGILLVGLILWGFLLTRQSRQAMVSEPSTPAPSAPAPESAPSAVKAPAEPVAPAVSAPAAPEAPSAPASVAPTREVSAAPPAPAQPAKATASAADITVSRIVIAKAVEDRKPAGMAEVFPVTQDRVYCYLELQDVARDQKITYVWTVGGETERSSQEIRKAERWRTWTYRSISGRKGTWKVEVLDEAGRAIASAAFRVE